jgi:general secretion pathway protein A
MYKDFFGLQHLPFNLTPDPSFLFLLPRHRQALAGLTYAVTERKGFVVLTGDAGTGKTTLVNAVLSRLPADRIESSILLNPTLTASEFLESVLLDFDIADVPASKAQRLWKLQEFLARAHRETRLALLIIDEAHKLGPELLEEIRLLGNLENQSEKFLQILLVGQSELDALLSRPDLRQFKQRIALRLDIGSLTPAEVEQYVFFRWAKAGAQSAPPFSPEAMIGVGRWSQGIPRLINAICDTALLLAYCDESNLVAERHVRAAAANLLLTDPTPQGTRQADPSANGHGAEKQLEIPTPPPVTHFPSGDSPMLSTLASYADPRANSSVFKRLAEKLGIV